MRYIAGFSILSGFLIGFLTNCTYWEGFAVIMFIYFLLEFLYRLGNKIVVFDLIIVSAVLTWVLMPVIFYHVYPKTNSMARIWVRYMPIGSDEYFQFAIPSTLMMIFGLRLPLGRMKVNRNPQTYLQNVMTELRSKPNTGMALIGMGLASTLVKSFAPASLEQVFYLMEHLTYVGFFYVLYSPNKYK
ncbi:MAG TPA: hypothetical protein VKR32_13165, partial [Puia sp.]|nr:hypothetical protein [Puia sp.]